MIETLVAMDPWTIWTFVGASLLLYLTPGPDMMFTIASGVSGGPRAGVAAALGISLGVLCHVCLAAAGLAALIAAMPLALDAIRYAGAAYLAVVAWQSWHAADAPERRGRAGIARAFRRGFVTNILNPKVALFIIAFLPQFTDPAIGPVWHQILGLGIILVAGAVVTDSGYGFFAGIMAVRVRRQARLLNRVAAVMFGGIAARLALA